AVADPNTANCWNGNHGGLADVGSYTGSPSPYGTFDQSGSMFEWSDTIDWNPTLGEAGPVLRGGGFLRQGILMSASSRAISFPLNRNTIGFRLAMIVPEPSTGLLVFAGMLGLAGWRRAHA